MQFTKLKDAVARQFKMMGSHDLFRAAVNKDEIWECYLGSFPDGTNPMYRERTEHDCSCCKQFIRAVGSVVAIVDGKLTSVWDVNVGDETYQVVADAMSALVKSRAIENVFLTAERTAGIDKNFEENFSSVKTWEHFFVNIPAGGRAGEKKFVVDKDAIGPRLSEARAMHDVLMRSLVELTDDAVDTVLELISQNSLYRGEEHKFAVTEFKKLKKAAKRMSEADLDNFVWSKIGEIPGSVSKIRNTSIGQLLIDLSAGRDMESAVGAFEAMVAPANYKRPTALVTKAMVTKARAKVEELGLTSALERRYANLSDVSVNNILFANRDARSVMAEGGVFDEIATAATARSRKMDKVEEVPVEKFISDILPNVTSLEVMVENRHRNNLVSLVAPADQTAGRLFKWDNLFSWSYNGDFADSIKERVKKAGGNVSGDFCCRLAWWNHDDLDFHMVEPGGHEIYFGNKGQKSPCGGQLDVDMNAGHGTTREPVENIFYQSLGAMKEGTYKVFVHNYSKRESKDVGFEVEVDIQGDVRTFAYEKAVKSQGRVVVAEFKYTRSGGLEIVKSLPSSTTSKKVWGIDTEAFVKANVVMFSPNHWDGHGVGNRHYFFMIDGCQNDGQARGFYNEFLNADLDPHRKVFEIVGSKMRTEETVDQLSGVGFSTTQRNSLLVRVEGAFTRTVRVMF